MTQIEVIPACRTGWEWSRDFGHCVDADVTTFEGTVAIIVLVVGILTVLVAVGGWVAGMWIPGRNQK